MRAVRQQSATIQQPADAVFQAAIGVVQNNKSSSILAVHNGARKLVVREKAKMSNPKLQMIFVEDKGGAAELHVTVGTDPRSPKALMDGKANDKALTKLLGAVDGAVTGSAPAPVTPVADHYVQGKTEVPWTDPSEEPDIELGGGFLAQYGL